MKALVSSRVGPPETLELLEVDAPAAGPGQLLVRVLACGVNYPDVLIIEDKYQSKPPRPFSPGAEICGVVEAFGEDVAGWSVGERLIAVPGLGGMAEKVVVTADEAVRIPADRDPLEAAALLLTYATTLHALEDRGELRAGETLLVLGAAGGVGLAAIEIGKAKGATVVAAVSSEAKAEAAKAAGADRTVIYPRGPFETDDLKALGRRFKETVGDAGADVIYDPVGGDYAEPAFRALGWGGRYLVVGFAAGIPKLPLNLTLLRSSDVRGVFWGAFATRDPAAHRVHVEQLLSWWAQGRIHPRVGAVFPLKDGGKALEWLAGRHAIGKAVVEVSTV